ncbi:GNAT family N-acetyltransferase [Chryseobacterium sp. C-71]|uniref:GNAT family N-acetyltransferase n=1 Tax=Chryseobacterium sp. C-71 TaxID=2893882 RepID=UPI001E495C5D|nr:GNAT family N-acetyltransferase [Chryseobacterium sp. C-71]UFH32498.1 GNAT family N-acetyltransferase [Chryseobacterium sp. C-71]
MNILKAETKDSELLTTITKRSKAYWGFSEEILKEWEHLLSISKDYIEKNMVYKLVENENIIGYYSYFSIDEKTIKLDNLFILPEFIGKGFGKILMNDFLEKANRLGIKKITLDAEPNAENFYKNFGFETVGQLESSIKDRYLPIMELR